MGDKVNKLGDKFDTLHKLANKCDHFYKLGDNFGKSDNLGDKLAAKMDKLPDKFDQKGHFTADLRLC